MMTLLADQLASERVGEVKKEGVLADNVSGSVNHKQKSDEHTPTQGIYSAKRFAVCI